MISFRLPWLAILLLHIYSSSSQAVDVIAIQACEDISSRISSESAVLYADDPDFAQDIYHWYFSSSQVPACVIEVGSTEDTGIALQIIGQSRAPFAVESGGHASNPGFSSTTGVHISLRRMLEVKVARNNKTVEIGFGNIWSDVFKKLDGSGVNVVGGRVPGPGVGGFTLGGGFSWKTNQFGMTCDTVKSYSLALPNGTATTIDASQSDLFFALKGGLNRYGVVTSAVFNAHTQPPLIYGGFNIYSSDQIPAILNATTTFFDSNTDPKAQLICTVMATPSGTNALVIFFHDGPSEPASFKPFDDITPLTQLPNVRTQSFSSFVSSIPSEAGGGLRGTTDTLPTSRLTPRLVAAVRKEATRYAKIMAAHGGTTIGYDIEPFLTSFGDKAIDSAYPHSNSPLPLDVRFAWTSEADDEYWNNEIRASLQRLSRVARSEGVLVANKYPNYAITETTAPQMYGATNTNRLRRIKRQVDPNGVMELTGGFVI